MRFRLPAAALALGIPLLAQAPAPPPPAKTVLENKGGPIRIPFSCGTEEIQSHAMTCPPEEPCPVYLELTGVEAAGGRVFAAGNLHTDAMTLSSILLATEDGGKTWHEAHERVQGAGLDQIQFADLETGWISGQTLGGVPRDPFLLLTRDGGKTWRAQPVFADGGAGAIEQFRFDSRTHGVLWMDRIASEEGGKHYEVYESQTGGESWSLREAADRPFQKPERAAGAVWRARPDPATRAYRVERNAGERWEPVAGFQIRVGECKEAETPLPEPLPEPPPAPPSP